jgi:hypothetical protein
LEFQYTTNNHPANTPEKLSFAAFIEGLRFEGRWLNEWTEAYTTVRLFVASRTSIFTRFAVRGAALAESNCLVDGVVEDEVHAIGAEITTAYLAPRLSVRSGISRIIRNNAAVRLDSVVIARLRQKLATWNELTKSRCH